MNHITRVIADIQSFKGPDEGELLVCLSAGRVLSGTLFTPAEAIKEVKANPGIEFVATEKWDLRGVV